MKKIFFLTFCFLKVLSAQVLEPSIGEVVVSPVNAYTVIRSLGEGVFGKVFEVRDSDNKSFAMKWYKGNPFDEWKAGILYSDAEREYLRGQAFNHPHIIRSVEVFRREEAQDEYTVLEFVSGKTVTGQEKGALTREKVGLLVDQLLSAVRHAYNQEYLHLDLHGNNVMIDEWGSVKVIDVSGFFSFDEIEWLSKKKSPLNRLPSKVAQFLLKHPQLQLIFAMPALPKNFLGRWLVSNFDDITDMCIRFMMLADFTREQRLRFRSDLKLLVWNLEADLEETGKIEFESSLEKLEETVKKYAVHHSGYWSPNMAFLSSMVIPSIISSE